MNYTFRVARAALSLLSILIVTTLSMGADFDGSWWKAAPPEERRGFLEGYIDCHTYDLGRGRSYDESTYVYAQRIDEDVQGDLQDLHTPVVTLLQREHRPAVIGANAIGKLKLRHGYHNGEFWRSSEAPLKLGFIEGYLWCQSHEVHSSSNLRFSKPPSEYVKLISKWYGTSDSNERLINPERKSVAIPDVLQNFLR
jgi:hypothetical protein